mgnify:CR=1 FL=1
MSVQVYIPTPFRRATSNTDRVSVEDALRRVLLGKLAVGSGVQVEGVHVDPNLVRPQLGARVEAGSRLGQHSAWLDDTVQADRGRWGGTRHAAILSGAPRGRHHQGWRFSRSSLI